MALQDLEGCEECLWQKNELMVGRRKEYLESEEKLKSCRGLEKGQALSVGWPKAEEESLTVWHSTVLRDAAGYESWKGDFGLAMGRGCLKTGRVLGLLLE